MKFKESKFKAFLDKAGDKIKENGGDVINISAKALTGNISGAISETIELLTGKDDLESKALLSELELKRKEFELETYKLEVQDRDSARNREVEFKKAGGQDVMMLVSGGVAMVAFLTIIFTILVVELPEKNENLVHQVIGITEGVAISVFTYYFGSSKGSNDKHKELMKKGN